MSELLLLGTSHKTAPLAVRERVALPEGRAEGSCASSPTHPEIREAVVLSTCNRTELYVVVSDPVEAETTVLGMLARQAGLRPTELIDGIYAQRNCDAARHLYRVTSGLESMIVGEAEVQGQVKRAYEAALAARTTGPLTNKLFRAALATGKRVRTETAIGAGGASVASVAVDAARGALGELASRHVLIIGAGETAELTARALSEQGVSTMFVANRRRERAIALAAALRRLDDRLRRAARPSSSGPTSSSPRPPRRTRSSARRSWRSSTARARRPAAAAARPRRPARHRSRVRARCPASRWSTSTACRRRSTRTHSERRIEARRAEGIVEEEIQALRGLARHARGAADDRRAARAGRRARRRSCSPRTRTAGRASASATASASRRCCARPSSGCCTSRRSACKALDAERRHARLSLLRELFGLDEPARGGAARGRGARARAALERAAARHARQRAGARAGALGRGAAAGGEVEIVEITTAGDLRPRRAATSRAGPARSSGRCWTGEIDLAVHSAKDVPGELADGHRDRRRAAARGPARRARRRAVARRAARAAPASARARCGAARSCWRCGRTSTWSSCAGTSTRGCASWRRARSTRSCSPPPGSTRLGRGDVAARRSRATSSCPRRARAACSSRRARATRLDGGRRPRARTRRCVAERRVVARLDASCHTPVGVHRARDGLRARSPACRTARSGSIDEAPDADAARRPDARRRRRRPARARRGDGVTRQSTSSARARAIPAC